MALGRGNKYRYWWLIAGGIACIVIVNILYSRLGDGSSSMSIPILSLEEDGTSAVQKCNWREGIDPDIYFMQTQTEVRYSAYHWFHMAENFMVQHAILKRKGALSDNRRIIYAFDKAFFTHRLGGITRMEVLLGTKKPDSNTESLFYTYLSSGGGGGGGGGGRTLPFNKQTRVGEFVGIPAQSFEFDEIQRIDLLTPSSTSTVVAASAGAASSHAVPRRAKPTPPHQRFSQVQVFHSWADAISARSIHSLHNTTTTTTLTAIASDSGNGNKNNATSTDSMGTAAESVVCARYMGAIGGIVPTIKTGHWFPGGTEDVRTFRNVLREACPADPTLLQETRKQRPFKMVFYQRDLSRKLVNIPSVIQWLQHTKQQEQALLRRDDVASTAADSGRSRNENNHSKYSIEGDDGWNPDEWQIEELLHHNERSPCELAHRLYNVDVLITTHGFQSMLMLFLPRPALIFEVFPYKYEFEGFVGPLGREYGIFHGRWTSPPITASNIQQHSTVTITTPSTTTTTTTTTSTTDTSSSSPESSESSETTTVVADVTAGGKGTSSWLLKLVPNSVCRSILGCRKLARSQDTILTQEGVQHLRELIQQHKAMLQLPHSSRNSDTGSSFPSDDSTRNSKSYDDDIPSRRSNSTSYTDTGSSKATTRKRQQKAFEQFQYRDFLYHQYSQPLP